MTEFDFVRENYPPTDVRTLQFIHSFIHSDEIIVKFGLAMPITACSYYSGDLNNGLVWYLNGLN